jgi:hypothetical protein
VMIRRLCGRGQAMTILSSKLAGAVSLDRIIIEKQLAILEEAIQANPADPDINKQYLRWGEDVDDDDDDDDDGGGDDDGVEELGLSRSTSSILRLDIHWWMLKEGRGS